MQPLLGTFVEVATVPDAEQNHIFDAAFAVIRDIHQSLSMQNAQSDLTRLNLNPQKWLAFAPNSLRILKTAQRFTQLSQGLFDCSQGASLLEKGIFPDFGYGHRKGKADQAALIFRSNQVKLNESVLITLDGIAKGFAVDLAVMAMNKAGSLGGYVNAGGDMRIFGDCQLPIILHDNTIPSGLLHNAAVASSGGQYSDDRPSYLVDQQSRPISNGKWSIIARCAWRADALTKVAANLRHDSALQTSSIEKLGGRLLLSQID